MTAKGKITITPKGESGRYILKPIPEYKGIRFRHNIPANEHLTMQIASQVYKINTAANALSWNEYFVFRNSIDSKL